MKVVKILSLIACILFIATIIMSISIVNKDAPKKIPENDIYSNDNISNTLHNNTQDDPPQKIDDDVLDDDNIDNSNDNQSNDIQDENQKVKYTLIEQGNKLFLFTNIGINTQIEEINFDLSNLPDNDRQMLKKGISAESKEELLMLLEDYSS